MKQADESLLISVPDAARALGIAPGLAYAMAREGQLPIVRLGKRAVRVPRDRLREWIGERTREGAATDLRVRR
jgi:excisionase family DNA binding protein